MKADLGGLDEGQLKLWPELEQTPPEFVLYGGVALTIRFRHRLSADFDFFCRAEFDPQELFERVGYLKGGQALQLGPNTLTCLVHRDKPVKISYFGLPTLGQAAEPEKEDTTGLRVASTLDIAATKASTIQKRAAIRDYLDMDLLVTEGDLRLPSILKAACLVYGPVFNPHITLKALSYFQDGDLATIPAQVRTRLQEAVRQAELEGFA